jgi:hypothetical protein
MKHKRQTFIVISLLTVGLTTVKAQEASTTAGGNATGKGGSVSYSVGQVFYTSNSGTGGSELQGVQQPYEISIVSGIEEQSITLNCIAYPNPTIDFLNLRIENGNQTVSTILLLDINGKLLSKLQINGNQSTLSMEQYAAGSYFVKVMQNNKERKTFKIIKQ